MKDKILFLFDLNWIPFGISKFFQECYDCEMFAVIDTNSKDFFLEQDIVKFQKIWFYRDHLYDITKIDMDYLRDFEKKYGINLWSIAYNERFFLEYNPYYKFSRVEILKIIYNECRLFEEVLNYVKPNFLITKFTDTHQSHLLYLMCKNTNVDVLMLCPARFGSRYLITDEYDKIPKLEVKQSKEKRSLSELQEYMKSRNTLKVLTPLLDSMKKSKLKKFQNYSRNLLLLNDKEVGEHYANFGKSKIKVISQIIFLKRWYRRKFLDRKARTSLNNEAFFYYPLHVEPERQLLMVAPYFMNQLEVIFRIAKAMPMGYKLYVKEHSIMELRGWRETSFYKKILNLPNVELFHPHFSNEKLLEKCSLVFTINGTSGIEGIFYNKPVVVFSEASYSILPSVKTVKNIEELPDTIKSLLGKEVNIDKLNNYINSIENESFNFDLIELALDFQNYFAHEYSTLKSDIPVDKMKKFLLKRKTTFSKLVNEYIKKIEYIKSKSVSQN